MLELNEAERKQTIAEAVLGSNTGDFTRVFSQAVEDARSLFDVCVFGSLLHENRGKKKGFNRLKG